MEKQQPESEDGIEGTRTTVGYTAADELEKRGGACWPERKIMLASAQWGT